MNWTAQGLGWISRQLLQMCSQPGTENSVVLILREEAVGMPPCREASHLSRVCLPPPVSPDAVAEARLCWVLAEWENSPCPATFWVLQTDVHTGVRLGSQKERRLDWGFKRFWRRGSHAYSAESYAGQRSIFQKQSPAPCLHGHWWGVHLCAPSDLAGLTGRTTMVVVSESPRLFLNGSGFVEPESVQPTIGFFISPNLRKPWYTLHKRWFSFLLSC